MNTILLELQNNVAIISLNRPGKHNAFSRRLLLELREILNEVENNHNISVVMLKGEGKSFSSGVDLSELLKLENVEQAKEFALLLEEVSEKIFRLSKPVIALLHGLVLGGAVGFAAAADIRIAAYETRFGFPAVKLGAILPATCTVYVESLIGRGHTLDLTLTGRIVESVEAKQLGLIDRVVGKGELMKTAFEYAGMISEANPLALELTKKTVNFPHTILLEQAKLYAADNFAFLSQTTEWKKRMTNFSQKKRKN